MNLLDSPCIKKLIVIGIIGNTQGVKIPRIPNSRERKKNAHMEPSSVVSSTNSFCETMRGVPPLSDCTGSATASVESAAGSSSATTASAGSAAFSVVSTLFSAVFSGSVISFFGKSMLNFASALTGRH